MRKLALILALCIAAAGAATPAPEACLSNLSLVYCPAERVVYAFQQDARLPGDYIIRFAVSTATGSLKWQVPWPDTFLHSRPVVTSDALIVSTGSGVPERLEAFATATGERVWTAAVRTNIIMLGGPYVIAGVAGGYAAIDPRTGRTVWHTGAGPGFGAVLAARDDTVLTISGAVDARSGRELARWGRSTPMAAAFAGEVIVLGTLEGQVRAYGPDFELRWSKTLFSDRMVTGVVGGRDVVVAVGYRTADTSGPARLALVSSAGDVRWAMDVAADVQVGGHSVAIVGDAVVFVQPHGLWRSQVLVLDLASGREVRRLDLPLEADTELVCAGPLCVLGSLPGHVFVIDVPTGAFRVIAAPPRQPGRAAAPSFTPPPG